MHVLNMFSKCGSPLWCIWKSRFATWTCIQSRSTRVVSYSKSQFLFPSTGSVFVKKMYKRLVFQDIIEPINIFNLFFPKFLRGARVVLEGFLCWLFSKVFVRVLGLQVLFILLFFSKNCFTERTGVEIRVRFDVIFISSYTKSHLICPQQIV